MVVICEECGLKYQIDPSKIAGNKARFNCKGCSTSIVVDKTLYKEENDLRELEDTLFSDSIDAGTTSGGAGGEEIAAAAPEPDPTPMAAAAAGSTAAAASSPETKKRGGMGLTSKVVLTMLMVSLLPMVIYFVISFNQTSARIIAETNETGITISGLLASEVDEWIDKNVRALKAVANLPEIKSMNQFDQEIALKALQAQYPWMYLVFTTDARGMNVARSDDGELRDYTNRQYVKDVVEGADLAWQNLIGKTSNKPALVLAVPIRNGDVIVGVMAAAMTREAISELVTNYKLGETGSTFLVDETGKAVAHIENAYVLQERDMSQHPLVKAANQGGARRVEFVDANGKETIGFAEKNKLGWVLAIQQEKSEAFEPLKKAQIFAVSLLGATAVIIIIVSILASRALVNPIRRLTDAANRISVGDLDVEIDTKSKDEIGDLAAAIMRMQDSIRLSISRLTRRRR